MRISDIFGLKQARFLSLLAAAALSWVSGSGFPEAVMTDEQGVLVGEFVQSAAAADTPAAKAGPAAEKSAGDAAATTVNGIIQLVMMLFLPATILAGWLLSPDWTFGEIFGLRPIIHDLWVLVSNVVYVIFAFLLIAMAFMNIFGAGWDHYAMKKALPRFVTGILIVPFTWFIVSGVLSISNLLTASVLRLPADMLEGGVDKNTKEATFEMPDKCTLKFDKLSEWGGDSKAGVVGKFFDCGDKKAVHQVSFKDALASDKGAYGILNLYAYGIFKVQDYQKIDKINLSSIAGISDMVINLGLWMLFLIVFALLVLALTFALFTRAFYLWVIAIFSPMFGLLYFMEGKGKLAETFKGKADFATFIGLAMVPVYVSAALGFGLLFVKMAENAELTPENSSFFSDVKGGGGKPGESTFVIGSTADGKKATTITVSGMPTGVVESAGTGKDAAKGGVKLAASAIGKIIIGILALVVLWMSVMAALSSSEITKQAVEPISQFGSSMGKLAMDMPKYMPIPLGGGHKTSMKGLETMGSNISTAISQKAVGDSSQLGQSLGNKLAGAMGYQDTAVSKALNKMDQTLARINSSNLSSSDIDGKAKLARELVQWAVNETGMSPQQALNSPEVRAKITAGLQKLYSLSDDDVKGLKGAGNAAAFDTEFQKLAHHNVNKGMDKIGGGAWVDEHDSVSSIMKWGEKAPAANPIPTVNPAKNAVSVNNVSVNLSKAGEMSQAEFNKLVADAKVTDQADLKKQLEKWGIKIVS